MRAPAPVTCEVALKGASAPEWVQLFPVGQMQARDGRRWKLTDPERLVASFEADKVDLAIDYEHQADKPARTGTVPAAGWIRALAVKGGALWGRVEWTERARKMIEAREYRFLTVLHVRPQGRRNRSTHWCRAGRTGQRCISRHWQNRRPTWTQAFSMI